MRYLENAFRFTFKNFLLTLPLLIAMAIPALVMGIGSMGFLLNFRNFQQMINELSRGGNVDLGPGFFFNLYGPAMIVSMITAGILSIVLAILVYPATYGLINKKYETGSASFSDITRCLSKFVGRYVLYLLLSMAIGIGIALVFGIFIAIGTVIIVSGAKAVGILLIVVFVLALLVGVVALKTYMSLWFPAVCIEDTGIIDGLKNSFRYVSGSFWPILGITLLVTLGGGIASMILSGIVGWIPVIGSVVGPVVSALAEFILIVFYFEFYRARIGKLTPPDDFQQINEGIQ